MIANVEQIHTPESGMYKEVIYDIHSSWNSQKWTWLKFTNDDFTEWCGELRGELRKFAYSEVSNYLIVLTSDYMYQINRVSGKLENYIERSMYTDVTATPFGHFIISDGYGIEMFKNNLRDTEVIKLPLHLDMIRFCGWNGTVLRIEDVEFCNWDNYVVLTLDAELLEVTIIS